MLRPTSGANPLSPLARALTFTPSAPMVVAKPDEWRSEMPGLVQGATTSSGIDESAARLNEVYGRVVVSGTDLDLSEQFVGDERFLLGTTSYRGRFSTVVDVDHVIVNVAGSGCFYEMGRDSGRLQDAPTLFQPGHPATAHINNLTSRTALLDRSTLEQTARTVYADDELQLSFDGPLPIDRGLGDAWRAMFDLARFNTGLLDSELLRASTYRSLAITTLEVFRLNGDRVRRHETSVGLLHAYRKGATFIEDHASLPITVEDVAKSAGVSLADLHRAFRAHAFAELSPDRYLRRTRLSAAHRDLLDGDPTTGDTVQAIAVRWGFAYPGSFARWYREIFHRAPGQTLRS